MPNKKNLHIVDSYKVWKIYLMKVNILSTACKAYDLFTTAELENLFNRSIKSMYIEWWLHNIGYYLTLPLCHIPYFKALNNRFKDVDLEEWK
jgi:hypothetical protein